ncbi:MAG TPA: hypothetical protein PKO06_03155, partial [Candidatus Ozemobacteraceae bacterium]|nr:hypothetical protein [Candidatus Ozemobacteraceae bacterium]
MRHTAAFLLGFQFLVRFGSTLLFIAAQTFFFRQAGVERLPALYAVVNLAFIVLQVFLLPFFRQRAGRTLGHLLVAMPFLLVVGFLAGLRQSDLGVSTLLLLVMVFELLFGQLFTQHLSETIPLQQGKSMLPMLSAFASISGIVAGITLRLLLAIYSLSEVYGLGTLILGCACLAWLMTGRGDETHPSGDGPEPPTSLSESQAPVASSSEPLSPALKDLLWLVLLLAGTNMFGKYWLDYQYSRGITRAFSTERDLASFMATFSSVTDLLIILTQMLLTGRLLRQWKLSMALYFMPALVLCGCLGHLGVGSLASLLAVQFLYTFLVKTCFQPSLSLVFSVFPAAWRGQVIARFGLMSSGAALITGLLLALGGNQWVETRSFLLLSLVFASCLWVVHRLDRSYVSAIVSALGLSERETREDLEVLTRLDQATRHSWLKRHLQQESSRADAVTLIPDLFPDQAAVQLLAYVTATESPKVREHALQALTRIADHQVPWIEAFLLDERLEVRTRAGLLESLGCSEAGPRYLPVARRLLENPQLRLQAAAAALIGKHENEERVLVQALERVWNWVENTADTLSQGAGVAVMGSIGHEAFVPALTRVASQGAGNLSLEAVVSLSRIPSPETRAALIHLQGQATDARVREQAEKESQRFERLSEQDMISILGSLNPDERQRLLQQTQWQHDARRLHLMRLSAAEPDLQTRRALLRFWVIADQRLMVSVLELDRDLEKQGSLVTLLTTHLLMTVGLRARFLIPLVDALAENQAWSTCESLLLALLSRVALEDACGEQVGRSHDSARWSRWRAWLCDLANRRSAGRFPSDLSALAGDVRFTTSLLHEVLLAAFNRQTAERLACVLL